jgi:DNA helicase-2/ATP-dependent DNA helicase PcrA
VTSAISCDAVIDGLTSEQRLAAATRTPNIFIEAGPGTGKTTVSAHRFAVQRFGPEFRTDGRAVVAVSFTRAATKNLVRRVQRLWGPSAISWPHRVVTLDTVMCDLVHDLLQAGMLRWPNGHTTLNVHDSWASFSGSTWNRTAYAVVVDGTEVAIKQGWVARSRSSIPATVSVPLLLGGTCTHEDIRDVLEQALANPRFSAFVSARLQAGIRSLVVDEVFDANDLDIAIVEAAINAGIAVTMVGDPWQALYVFRGARPEVVPQLLERTGIRSLSLTQSFRWKDTKQQVLAQRLRAGQPVTLPVQDHHGGICGVDVVLALMWKPLWDLGGGVLPLAFHAFKGGTEEAAATLLLNHVTRNIFSLDATYLNDALTALAITDRDVPRQLESELQGVAAMLRIRGRPALNAAYNRLLEIVRTVSPRTLRPAHHSHTHRLALIQDRLAHPGRPVPGLTTHRAKGGEWDAVGVRITDGERHALAGGLSVAEDTHRKLYVACTRARHHTMEWV